MGKGMFRLNLRKWFSVSAIVCSGFAIAFTMQNCGVAIGSSESSSVQNNGNGGSYGGQIPVGLYCVGANQSGNGLLHVNVVKDEAGRSTVIQDTEMMTTERHAVLAGNLPDGSVQFSGTGVALVLAPDRKSASLELERNGIPVRFSLNCP